MQRKQEGSVFLWQENTMTITSTPFFRLDYGGKIEREIARIVAAIEESNFNTGRYSKRWLAIKLLEKDPDILEHVQSMEGGEKLISFARERAGHVESMLGDDFDLLTADRRYGYINGVVRQSLQRPLIDRLTLTDRIDNIVTHKWLGLPVFFAVMYIVFRLVIDVSAPFLDWTDAIINGPLANWLSAFLNLLSAPAWIHSLLIDGIVAGVGGVLVFVPGLLILYFFLALLEDSGYMSRAAFVMDRFMRVVGLHGKSFIPMILGFGCAVPAVYATRTIASGRDRVLTALLVPLMSCSPRLPVYVVFGLAFFGARAGTVKSAIGIGALLWFGIGDTIRVSLSAEPEEEVRVGFEILKSLGIRNRGVRVVSCPSCARQGFDVIRTVQALEERLGHIKTPLSLSVLGCVVNGPGEARETDIGLTGGGKGKHMVYLSGVTDHHVSDADMLDHIVSLVEAKAAEIEAGTTDAGKADAVPEAAE